MTKWSGALVALALASCVSAPTTDEQGPEQQGARLMAQMKAASGGAKLDTLTTYHSTGTRLRNGTVPGTFETWGDFKAMKYVGTETFQGEPSSTSGYDGKTTWTTGPDGKAVFIKPENLPGAKVGVYLNLQAYFWPDRFPAKFEYSGRRQADGKSFDVVTATPEGSLPVDLWLDLKTHRLARLSGSNGRATFTGVIESEQVVDGVWIVDHAVQTMQAGTQTFTETAHVATFKFEPVPTERFVPPK